MKRYLNLIAGFPAILALLLSVACSDNADLEKNTSDDPELPPQEEIVTFLLQPENGLKGTRDGETELPSNTISNGEKVDILIFAVYEKGADGNFILAPEFSKAEGAVRGITPGAGQNILDLVDDSEYNHWPVKIQLAVNPAKEYKVAFWAQNSETDAYDASDLKKIKVNYKDSHGNEMPNNDELRDAFCATEYISAGKGHTQHVVLRRPFAQINVGTTGADYYHLMTNDKVFPNMIVQESRLVIEGACDLLDLVTGEASMSDSFNGTVDYTWAAIPGFINLESLPVKGDVQGKEWDNLLRTEGEEMLYVKLNENVTGSDPFNKYAIDYPTVRKDPATGKVAEYLTEVFKYMTMCYVLVPSVNGNGSTVKVKIYFRDYETKSVIAPIAINDVPVQCNWRTNILGGLNVSDVPEDETSIFNTRLICVHFDPIYDGEYNNINSETKWKETEFPQGDGSLHDDNGHHENE